jgi:murein DD-endopeptidase MepM/ murein hydrolase activator NlpD
MLKLLLLVVFLLGTQLSFSNSDLDDVTSVPKSVQKAGKVERGQGLFQALKSVSIEGATALEVINSLRDEVEFSSLKVGDALGAKFHDDKLISFSFSQNPAEIHHLIRSSVNKWDYSFEEIPTFWNSKIVEGSLTKGSTLQADLINKGLSRVVTGEVVNILLCKVNFRMNAREGDKYKVLIKERKLKDQVIETKVMYTSYSGTRAGSNEAFYYDDGVKGSTYTAHYTKTGQALIRSGLRYPLPRLHIRSHYGKRTHPVTGRRVMHRGVDLRGRRGQSVRAVASGKVVVSSYNKYAGNKVAIKHRDGSTSYYLHLNKRNVRKGQWVKSYQKIGSVGATGRVTGPHLHFGFKKPNGRWMNPMNKRMIATPKLAGPRLAHLEKQILTSESLIDSLEISRVAKYIVKKIPNQKEESVFDLLNWDENKLFQTSSRHIAQTKTETEIGIEKEI